MRLRVESVGRTSVRSPGTSLHDGEVAIRATHTDRPRRRRRPAGADRRPRTATLLRVSRNLILSRRGGRDGRLGSQHRLAAAPAGPGSRREPRVRRGAVAVPGRPRRRRARRLLGRARARPRRRGRARHGALQQRRPVLQHAAAAARVRPAGAHASTGGCSTRTSRASGWPRSRRRSGGSRAR